MNLNKIFHFSVQEKYSSGKIQNYVKNNDGIKSNLVLYFLSPAKHFCYYLFVPVCLCIFQNKSSVIFA